MRQESEHINDIPIGKKFRRLTVDELRTYKGFENYSDEQAEQTIQTLVNLSLIFFEAFKKKMEQEEKALSETVIKKLEPNKKDNNDETRIAA